MEHKQPTGYVPLWELHFHCWEAMSGKRFISGQDFMKLSEIQKMKAIEDDAEIIVSLSEQLRFAAVPYQTPVGLPIYTT